MAKDEERSVGTRDMVTNPLVNADNFIGHNGGLELLVLFGKKMAVFKELDGLCVGYGANSGVDPCVVR